MTVSMTNCGTDMSPESFVTSPSLWAPLEMNDMPLLSNSSSASTGSSVDPVPSSSFDHQQDDSGLQDEIARVLGILDCAEEVISSPVSAAPSAPSFPPTQDSSAGSFLEPTPLGPEGVQSVFPPQFSFHQMLSNMQQTSAPMCSKSLLFDKMPMSVPPQALQQSLQEDTYASRPSKKQCRSFAPSGASTTSTSNNFTPLPTSSNGGLVSQIMPSLVASPQGQQQQTETGPTAARFRKYQCDQWMERFQDLIEFKQQYGHCLVPHNFPPNQQLAQWTKRQRYQFKLKQLNRHSTLTDARQTELEDLGFVWDSHKAAWFERLESLKTFKLEQGHCNVPSNYEPDRPLAIWVKCQRRQMKLFNRGQKSTMTPDRIRALDVLGFDWNPRNL